MKETWLFGKLDTLGEDERDIKRREQLEKDALAVKQAVEEGGLLKVAEWFPGFRLASWVQLGWKMELGRFVFISQNSFLGYF